MFSEQFSSTTYELITILVTILALTEYFQFQLMISVQRLVRTYDFIPIFSNNLCFHNNFQVQLMN